MYLKINLEIKQKKIKKRINLVIIFNLLYLKIWSKIRNYLKIIQ